MGVKYGIYSIQKMCLFGANVQKMADKIQSKNYNNYQLSSKQLRPCSIHIIPALTNWNVPLFIN